MQHAEKILRSLRRLVEYPSESTLESAELLYVALQPELPQVARRIAEFGEWIERCTLEELEETYTKTFDVNPDCALEVGWHLFGEEYTRGLFLVRMREELRRYGLAESAELPDHITHVLDVIGAMPKSEAARFVRACVLPAVETMRDAFHKCESQYRNVFACLAEVLKTAWGGRDGETLTETSQPPPRSVDPLHAFPVADVGCNCSSGCGGMESPVSDRTGQMPQFVPLAAPSRGRKFVPLEVQFDGPQTEADRP